MQLKKVNLTSFRRFKDLTIEDLPQSVRLVVLTGTNGSGKSSLFDAFNLWHRFLSKKIIQMILSIIISKGYHLLKMPISIKL
jgi:AAA15 family ATPase/GTPase